MKSRWLGIFNWFIHDNLQGCGQLTEMSTNSSNVKLIERLKPQSDISGPHKCEVYSHAWLKSFILQTFCALLNWSYIKIRACFPAVLTNIIDVTHLYHIRKHELFRFSYRYVFICILKDLSINLKMEVGSNLVYWFFVVGPHICLHLKCR